MFTEDSIERAVERKFDSLDARLMNGTLSQSEYDRESLRVAQWGEDQYRKMDAERARTK